VNAPDSVRLRGYLKDAGDPTLNSDDHDALQSFLKDIDKVGSIKNITSRRWERNSVFDLKPLLSQICKLEKQDVSIFLPQSDIDKALGGSHRTNDRHEVAYFENGLLTEEERHSRTTLFFPAIVAVSKNRKPKFRIQPPAVNIQDPETAFLGELHLSQMLQEHMEQAYRPEEEWTSHLRTKAGYRPYNPVEGTVSSTFTIRDRTGSFTRLLTRNGYRDAMRWAAQPTFHLDVITLEEGLQSVFCLHPDQMEIVSAPVAYTSFSYAI